MSLAAGTRLGVYEVIAQIVEHPYRVIERWMEVTHFLMKRLENVRTEMSLRVLAYNMRRAIDILGVAAILGALEASLLLFRSCHSDGHG